MQPLLTTNRMMMWLSMCSADQSSTQRQRIAYVAFTSAIFLVNLISFLASLTYVFTFFSTNFDNVVFSFMTMTGEFGMIYIMIVAILMKSEIVEIFKSLSTIYKTSKLIPKNFIQIPN